MIENLKNMNVIDENTINTLGIHKILNAIKNEHYKNAQILNVFLKFENAKKYSKYFLDTFGKETELKKQILKSLNVNIQ